MPTLSSPNREIVIEPSRHALSFNLLPLWEYRELLWLFARLEYISKIKQTILGPLWYILNPILTAAMMVVIFSKVVEIPSNGIPPLLFYLSGLVAWGYFSQCLTTVSSSLSGNAHLFRKVYLPRLIIPLSVLVAKLIPFFIQLAIFLLFWLYFKFFSPQGENLKASWVLLALPLYVLQIAALALGVGLIFASLSVRYRDLHHVVGLAVQLWMYATPVFYPGILISEKWRPAMALNPMASIVEALRQGFFSTYVSWTYLGLSLLVTFLLLVTGLIAFHRVERNFVDTI